MVLVPVMGLLVLSVNVPWKLMRWGTLDRACPETRETTNSTAKKVFGDLMTPSDLQQVAALRAFRIWFMVNLLERQTSFLTAIYGKVGC